MFDEKIQTERFKLAMTFSGVARAFSGGQSLHPESHNKEEN